MKKSLRKPQKLHTVSALIMAAGRSERFSVHNNAANKLMLEINDLPVLGWTIGNFARCQLINEIVIASKESDILFWNDVICGLDITVPVKIVRGGDTRQESVLNGLREVSSTYAAIHDGARALTATADIEAVIAAAFEHGAATLGEPEKNTLKVIDGGGFLGKTVDRSNLFEISTPQVFLTAEILEFHRRAKQDGITSTDDTTICLHYGRGVKAVTQSQPNYKLTTESDLPVFCALLYE